MRLTCADPRVSVGQTLRMNLTITNRSSRAIVVDNGSLISFTVVEDSEGTAIPQWPFMDILTVPPGKEACWTIKPREIVTVSLSVVLARRTWSGFGVPNGTYQGVALEVHHEHGAAIHALPSLPATIILKQGWISDAATVRARVKQTGVRRAWSGSLTSNPLTVELVDDKD
jgi:hypothetical protein